LVAATQRILCNKFVWKLEVEFGYQHEKLLLLRLINDIIDACGYITLFTVDFRRRRAKILATAKRAAKSNANRATPELSVFIE
jgi:hypothetical protein